MTDKKQILLHICCGICSSACVESLKSEGYNVTGFFYNPNIHPEEEYIKRLNAVRTMAKVLDFELIEGPYDKDNWLEMTKDLKDEAENGARCTLCYKMRLKETNKKAIERSYVFSILFGK